MKPHFTTIVAALVLHSTFSILNSAFAAILTAGIEYPQDAPPACNLIVQCIDTNSALLGQWTVPPTGNTITNSIAATYSETNATIAISSLPASSAKLAIGGVTIASWNGGDVMVAPAMRIGSTDAASGLADIDLRLMRKALGAWLPQAYGTFTNEYAGVTATVVCTSSPLERSEGRGFVVVDAQGLSVSNLDGAVVSAFLDADGNGRYTAGELFGCAILCAEDSCLTACPEIALTRTHPSMARFDLSPLLSGEAAVAVDRSLVPGSLNGWALAATNSDLSVSSLGYLRLRVVRDGFNEDSAYLNSESYYREVVLDRTFNARSRPLFTEADLLAAGLLDLDWGGVFNAFSSSAIGSASKINLRSATYRVFVGNGDIVSPDADTNILPVKFVNAFEALGYQSATEPLTPHGSIDSVQPTFTWRHDKFYVGEYLSLTTVYGMSYPAFNLRILLADSTNIVFDSGPRWAPPRNSSGVYSWTAPKEWTFARNTNYSWSVSILNAKFPVFRPDRPGGETNLVFMIAP